LKKDFDSRKAWYSFYLEDMKVRSNTLRSLRPKSSLGPSAPALSSLRSAKGALDKTGPELERTFFAERRTERHSVALKCEFPF